MTKFRILAASIDNLFALIAGFLAGAFYGRMLGPFQPTETVTAWSELPLDPSATGWLVVGMGYLAYFFVLESVWGSTLGKGLFGLRVARLDGKPVGLSEAWWRTLTRIFELNPLLLGPIPGGLIIVRSKHRQRLGDMIAGTVVVSRTLALAFAAGQAHQPRISNLVRGRIDLFSIDTLVEMLARAGIRASDSTLWPWATKTWLLASLQQVSARRRWAATPRLSTTITPRDEMSSIP